MTRRKHYHEVSNMHSIVGASPLSRISKYNESGSLLKACLEGRTKLAWSGSGSVIRDHLDHGRPINRWILVQSGFIASFDLPWSGWSRVTDPDPDPDHLKGTHPKLITTLITEVLGFRILAIVMVIPYACYQLFSSVSLIERTWYLSIQRT